MESYKPNQFKTHRENLVRDIKDYEKEKDGIYFLKKDKIARQFDQAPGCKEVKECQISTIRKPDFTKKPASVPKQRPSEIDYTIIHKDYMADKKYSFFDYKKNLKKGKLQRQSVRSRLASVQSQVKLSNLPSSHNAYADVIVINQEKPKSKYNQNLRRKPNVFEHSLYFNNELPEKEIPRSLTTVQSPRKDFEPINTKIQAEKKVSNIQEIKF